MVPNDQDPTKLEELAARDAEILKLKTRATELEGLNTGLEGSLDAAELSKLEGDFQRGLDWLVAGRKMLPADADNQDVVALCARGREVAEAMLGAWAMGGDVVKLGAHANGARGEGSGNNVELSDEQRTEQRAGIRERLGLKKG